ncbi:MAG: hypothetical protein NZM37_07215 [Sandaracinaceae bacterium]|nr:hypothetical protein [Sandaracinaceae bacterium]MDW8246314.1 hypothetical protein [Sandaracinaceae bacterium]
MRESSPHFAFERAIEGLAKTIPGEEVLAARASFERRTGAAFPSDPFYEERTRAFLEELVCEHLLPSGETPAQATLRQSVRQEDAIDREVLVALGRAERGLFQVEERGGKRLLRCLFGNVRYDITMDSGGLDWTGRLGGGEIFDGRLVPFASGLRLLPGLIFHPPQAVACVVEIVKQAKERRVARRDVLDGLLRMRMRHDRFPGVHPKHFYRFEALWDLEIRSASWRRHGKVLAWPGAQ